MPGSLRDEADLREDDNDEDDDEMRHYLSMSNSVLEMPIKKRNLEEGFEKRKKGIDGDVISSSNGEYVMNKSRDNDSLTNPAGRHNSRRELSILETPSRINPVLAIGDSRHVSRRELSILETPSRINPAASVETSTTTIDASNIKQRRARPDQASRKEDNSYAIANVKANQRTSTAKLKAAEEVLENMEAGANNDLSDIHMILNKSRDDFLKAKGSLRRIKVIGKELEQ